ncbi:hypothetical protein B0J17DRAFT_723092 [Rhizoctonia solani]|nr:hypothetical protein B0J17DRAFT_723092 [Rhizoctonia solani]
MSGENNVTADTVPAANEEFTQGGDLTLRSTDGIDFSVHSIILSLASPVFSDLLATENRSEIVQFSEEAEVLALVLKFIYPKPTPMISSMDLFNDAMRVANKYQLGNMKSRLREQLNLAVSPVSIYANPIGAFYVASKHGFCTEAKLATSLVLQQCDLRTEDDLGELLKAATNLASAALVELNGILLVKTGVLTDVLFRFESTPMTINSNREFLICKACRDAMTTSRPPIPPPWQIRWARWIFD